MSDRAATPPPPGPKTLLRAGAAFIPLGTGPGSALPPASEDGGLDARRALAEEIRAHAARTATKRRPRR